MKRIILIGNGFDRSLNLPTRYSDFLNWIFRETIKVIINNEPSGNMPGSYDYQCENEFFECQINIYTLDWIKNLYSNNKDYKYFSIERRRLQKQRYYNLTLKAKHEFISTLFNFYDVNGWVDIERMYFDSLLNTSPDEIVEFNDIFEIIKQNLALYINSISFKNTTRETFNRYKKHFFGAVLKYNSAYQSYEESDINPDSFYFLNFNYTTFLRDILYTAPEAIQEKLIINEIHGSVNSHDIIFGYGNEIGEEYSKLEKLGNNYLENIKSTHYFKSTHYRDLEMQLNDPYEVYVYGLSCGLSDNILLRTVMQKNNCQQIRIFYHKDSYGSNYRNILMNISRVFDDKEDMRSKIITQQENDFIPQMS